MAMTNSELPQPATPTTMSPSAADKKRSSALALAPEAEAVEDAVCSSSSWKEKLKRHCRLETAARRVWVPDTWGQEGALINDWDAEAGRSAALDRALFPAGLLAARESLVEECRRRSGRQAGRITAAPAPVRVISNSC